jgi:hypothetical protein
MMAYYTTVKAMEGYEYYEQAKELDKQKGKH